MSRLFDISFYRDLVQGRKQFVWIGGRAMEITVNRQSVCMGAALR